LYKVEPGVCSKSYGIEVARLADFPKEIVDEAEAISAALERESSPIQELLSPSSSAATAPLSKRHRTA
jgi:DNA mismatch repair protein MutS